MGKGSRTRKLRSFATTEFTLWFFLLCKLSPTRERVTGIEPVSQPWEGRILPLNHTRL